MIKLECLQDSSPRKRRTLLPDTVKLVDGDIKGTGAVLDTKDGSDMKGEAFLYIEKSLPEDFLTNALTSVVKKLQHNV